MELEPATITQVSRAKSGRMIAVDDDVQGVVNDLHALDPRLRVRYSEAGGYFVVYLCLNGIPDEQGGDSQLVLTAQELDQRIVKRIRYLLSDDYNLVADLDRMEAERKREQQWKWSEWAGETGERLAHAMRKDRGYKNAKAFVPKDITA